MISYEDFLDKLPRAHDYGKYISGMCPFHDDQNTPSLLVYRDGWFRCLSAHCNRHGTWTTLWNKLSGQPIQIKPERKTRFARPSVDLENLEAATYQAHIDLETYNHWGWYLELRRLTDSIEIAEIGYTLGWYTFPVRDKDGNFITTVFRAAPHVQAATGFRYWCDHAPVPYVPDWSMMRNPDFVLVVFGILDALTVNKYRYPVMTSTAGADTFKAEWLDEIRRPVYILPDKGEERTAIELAGRLGWRGNVHMLDYPDGCKDPNDFLQHDKEQELISQLSRIDKKAGRT